MSGWVCGWLGGVWIGDCAGGCVTVIDERVGAWVGARVAEWLWWLCGGCVVVAVAVAMNVIFGCCCGGW